MLVSACPGTMNAYLPPKAPPQSKAPAAPHLSLESPIGKAVCWLARSARFPCTVPTGDAGYAASEKCATALSAKPWSPQRVSGRFFAHSPLIRETGVCLNHFILWKVLSLGVSLPQQVLSSLKGIEEIPPLPAWMLKEKRELGSILWKNRYRRLLSGEDSRFMIPSGRRHLPITCGKAVGTRGGKGSRSEASPPTHCSLTCLRTTRSLDPYKGGLGSTKKPGT